MELPRRAFLAVTAASVAAPAVIRQARGDAPQATLKLHHFFSAVSCGHDRFLVPWARKVEADSGGRLRIDIFPSMALGGQPAQLFDQVRDGLADIAWAAPGLTPGRFARVELFELPFVPARRALVNSRALEDYAAAHLQEEFREVRPICFSCMDPGVLHANRPIRTVDELKSLRLHVRNRFAGEAVQVLGGRAVPMPSAELPAAIATHVIDGCLDPWNLTPALRLYDLLKSHTDFAESSLSTTTLVLAMNKAAYDRLPRDLKAAIDNNSGPTAAGMAGAMWDLAAAGVADMVAKRGDAIVTLMPAAVAHWRRATEPVVDAWRKQMKERKIDGGWLLANAQDLLAKYASLPEPQPPQTAQPVEQKVVAQPQQRPETGAGADLAAMPKVDTAAGTMPTAAPATTPAASAAAAQAAPVAKPPTPAPAAASPRGELDIPL